MRKHYFAPALLAFAAISCSSSGADSDGDGEISAEEAAKEAENVQFTPGEWENTVEFVDIAFDSSKMPEESKKFLVPMMEKMKGQTFTDSRCMTEEQAKNPQEEFFNVQPGQECKFDRFSLAGGNIDLAMSCTGENGSDGKVSAAGEYSKDSYTMNMTIATANAEQGDVTITAKSTAKRLGECTS